MLRNLIQINKVFSVVLVLGLLSASQVFAAGKTFTEDEFITKFSGKTKKVVTERLGKPVKTSLSVKPSNASQVTGKNLDNKKEKPVKVEMWYYKNIVKYDPKHTYKETEITFVNDRVMNIAFMNNK